MRMRTWSYSLPHKYTVYFFKTSSHYKKYVQSTIWCGVIGKNAVLVHISPGFEAQRGDFFNLTFSFADIKGIGWFLKRPPPPPLSKNEMEALIINHVK